MLTQYIRAAMRYARYEILSDDDTFYGAIPQCEGVYAHATNLETCRDQLEEVLEGWLLARVARHLPLPVIDGIAIVVPDVGAAP